MVKTGLKIYRDNIWHFFTILGFVALGLIVAFSIMIPAMTSTVNKTTNDIANIGKSCFAGFNVDNFFSSLGNQFKAMDWANPLNTLKALFTESKLIEVLNEAVKHAGVDLKLYPELEAAIVSGAKTIIDTSVTQLFVLVASVSICSIIGYVLIKLVIHFKTTKNYNIGRLIINIVANVLFIGLIAYLFVITSQKLDGAGMWISLIAITIFQTIGELTISFLTFANKGIKFNEIVNVKTIISSLITSLIIACISFAIVAIIYPFNSLAAIMIAIPLLIITTIIMDSVTNAFVTNFNKNKV